MACPACGCRETYQFDADDDFCTVPDSGYERCAACHVIFDVEDHAPEDEDDELAATSTPNPIPTGGTAP